VTDENGVSRVVQVDGIGRPTAVCEVSSTTLSAWAPANCGLDITSASGFRLPMPTPRIRARQRRADQR